MTRIILLAGAVLVLYHFTLSDRSPGMDKASLQMTYSAVASWL